MPNQEHEREREIKHIATGTYPQPRGWTTTSSSWRRRDDEDGHWWGIAPSGRVPEQCPDWLLVATEASGGGTPDLIYVLEVLGYMELYRQKKHVRGATGAPRGRGHAPTLVGSSRIFWRGVQVHQVCFLPKITSPVDFVPFRLHLIFLFFETLKKAKTAICTRPWVNRLVPKII